MNSNETCPVPWCKTHNFDVAEPSHQSADVELGHESWFTVLMPLQGPGPATITGEVLVPESVAGGRRFADIDMPLDALAGLALALGQPSVYADTLAQLGSVIGLGCV